MGDLVPLPTGFVGKLTELVGRPSIVHPTLSVFVGKLSIVYGSLASLVGEPTGLVGGLADLVGSFTGFVSSRQHFLHYHLYHYLDRAFLNHVVTVSKLVEGVYKRKTGT
ncbi:MAG: hypothetical protein WCA79_13770, partial [Anaerolineales bacterium]